MLGYVRAAIELIDQSKAMYAARDESQGDASSRLFWDAIVVCSGSGGTHTGLLTGLRAAGISTPVIGISVRFDAATQAARISEQCDNAVRAHFGDFAGLRERVAEDVVVLDEFVGPGYSLPTEEMAEAIELFARRESMLLDPVYTGKGGAALLELVREGRFGADQRVLFVHTGGAPSLFHYKTLPEHDVDSAEEE